MQKTAVITGASSGIGYSIARGMAAEGYTTFLICRNKERGIAAAERIKAETGNDDVYLFLADLASQKQIHRLAEEIKSKTNRIDVLVNNAGGVSSGLSYTADGIEWQFAVNHLAPFLLTALLLDQLKAAPGGRIINMSSRAHQRGSMHFEDLFFEKKYSILQAYNQSKLANILFTYELAKRLKDTSVTVNCMHPGLVNTPFGNKQVNTWHSFIWSAVKMLGKSPDIPAETAIYLATAPEVASISGKYFADKKEASSSEESHNAESARKLWEISVELTGAKYP